jgi:hypothetical protein
MDGAGTYKTVLMMADISGYTSFMVRKRKSLAHAQAIISELLKSIIGLVELPLRVAEIEGDAVFIYAMEGTDCFSWGDIKARVREKLLDFFKEFQNRLERISRSNMCRCEACEGINKLKLKLIVHVGEVIPYRLANFSKVSGPAVIELHRLVKNTIPSKEYLLMTLPAYEEIGRPDDISMQRRTESLDNLGNLTVFVHYPEESWLRKVAEERETDRISWLEKILQTMRISTRGMMYMLGFKQKGKVSPIKGLVR